MAQVIITTQEELETIIEVSIRRAFTEQGKVNPASDLSKLLSVGEAAIYLNLAQQTLYGFTSKNLVPFIKKGKKLYFKKADLDQWLLSGKQKTVIELKKEWSTFAKATGDNRN